ncbi:MAG: Carbon-monoxide dehydrogenase (acceptor) [Acidimicrobiales bacterium]|nr:Carbon-monoxide dehydrogenase (acceptor) [Acidimicrobiales bacterium]
MEAGLEWTSRYSAKGPTMANASHACVVEIDPASGMVEILRYVVSEDCGVVINPQIVEGQITGAVLQGLSGVLLENAAYDESGNPVATTFMDYLLPTAVDAPVIEFRHIETPSNTPGGHKGAGEGGTVASPAALINAIADALGMAITHQPLGPKDILRLIDQRRQAAQAPSRA